MNNLPTLTINTKCTQFKIPSEGDLKFEYDAFKNLQTNDGEIIPFNTDKIKFDLSHPLIIDTQPSYDGSVNLIINDDKNPPLLINSRFSVQEGNTFQIIDHVGTADTNLYWEDLVDLDTRLYKTVTKIPKLEFLGLGLNGKLACGVYNFYFKYSDNDGNETDFITESGIVTCHIGNLNDPKSIRMGMQNENSQKIVKFRLSNIDTQYDLIKVYYTRTTSDNSGQDLVTAHYIDSKYIINSDKLELTITGFEPVEDIAISEINPSYQLVDSAKAQAQCQNMLFLGNVNKPRIPYQELADLSLRFIPTISAEKNIGNIDANYVDRSGDNLWEYYNANNIYNFLGYWPEEYYRFGIVYILNDFTLSPVFNVRGLDFGLGNITPSPVPLKDAEGNRVYINHDDYLINNRLNEFENSKGVIKFPKQAVITRTGVKPIGLKFTLPEDVKAELSKYTKGCFFVRQERIPTILAQGCAIGKTKDDYGNLPVIPVGSKAIIESFITTTTIDLATNLSDDNPLLCKEWKWRYPLKYKDTTLIEMGVIDKIGKDDDNTDNTYKIGETQKLSDDSRKKRAALDDFVPVSELDPYNKALYIAGSSASNRGDIVRIKSRLPERIGNGLYGYWEIDEAATNKLIELYGSHLRALLPKFLDVTADKFEIKASIIPEAELREPLFNQLFTSSEYTITKAAEQGNIIKASDVHYYLLRNNVVTDPAIRSALLTMVNDGMKLTTNGKDYFSARAGEAEQAWETVDVAKSWTTPFETYNSGVSKPLTQSDTLVRGNFGTYVGLGDVNLSAGDVFNVRPKGYNDSLAYKLNEFKVRFSNPMGYRAISDRLEWSDFTNIICYRGDAFVGNFTHKMQRNFADPELPLNNKIIDPYTWHKNYAVFQDSKFEGKAVNRVLITFKRNNKGKILEPSDAKYDKAGAFKDTLTGGESYTVTGCDKINRADVNAVNLGHWFTMKVMSNINISMRDIDMMNPAEESVFGQPRSFHPLKEMTKTAVNNLPDSNIINGAANATLSHRYNFILPDVPFLKNKFDTRVLYSDIHVTDAFRNGYRVFQNSHYRDLPKTYGALTSLVEYSGNLIAVMENGVLLIPVNERALAGEGSGGNVYINTSNVLPENPNVLSDSTGSIWSDSILSTGGAVYGVDTNAKKIWKVGMGEKQLQFTNLSDLKVQKFLNDNINLKESDKIPFVGIKNVKTHYNAFKGDVMFTFYNDDKIWNLCYNEHLDKFITFYSWCPSYSENINNVYFSFDLDSVKNGFNNVFYKQELIINKTTSNFNFNKLIDKLANSQLYTFKINKSEVFEGVATKFSVRLYDFNTDTPIVISDFDFKNSENVISFTTPSLGNWSLIIYSGIRGKTSGVSSKFSNIALYKGNNSIPTNLWKHGQAGVYDFQGAIKPTKWYDKQEPFEFEFVVKEVASVEKIFNNLMIISNKAKPKEFEFEVVGESYDWNEYKDEILDLNTFNLMTVDGVLMPARLVTDTDTDYLKARYKAYLTAKTDIKKLPFIIRLRKEDLETDAQWEANSTNVWLQEDKDLNEYRIHTNQLGNDIKQYGRLRGNMQYLESLWNIEIRPINFEYAYISGGVLKFTTIKQSRLRDKYIKIKVRYSGEDLVIVQALKTLFTISYA